MRWLDLYSQRERQRAADVLQVMASNMTEISIDFLPDVRGTAYGMLASKALVEAATWYRVDPADESLPFSKAAILCAEAEAMLRCGWLPVDAAEAP